MRLTLLIASLVIIGGTFGALTHSNDEEARRLFHEFKVKYAKNYNGYDESKRFAIFKDNLRRMEQYQKDELGTAKYGVTQFSDLTAEEFTKMYANARLDANWKPKNKIVDMPEDKKVPKKFDWRTKGAVGPVLNQGSCGSCWAFSVVGNVEGQWAIKMGKLLNLSQQQLVDCDQVAHGCDGGYPQYTFNEIRRMGGLELASDYPYQGTRGYCHIDRTKFAAYVNGSVYLTEDEEVQKKWLYRNGPMSVALNADPLQFYRSGIMNPEYCPSSGINHAVLTVGYGYANDRDYWIVKNSWGSAWGENGYFRILRGHGVCGINLLCTSAVVIKI